MIALHEALVNKKISKDGTLPCEGENCRHCGCGYNIIYGGVFTL